MSAFFLNLLREVMAPYFVEPSSKYTWMYDVDGRGFDAPLVRAKNNLENSMAVNRAHSAGVCSGHWGGGFCRISGHPQPQTEDCAYARLGHFKRKNLCYLCLGADVFRISGNSCGRSEIHVDTGIVADSVCVRLLCRHERGNRGHTS